VSAKVKLNHELNLFLSFLSLQEGWWIWLLLTQFLVVLTSWLILNLLLLDSRLLLADLHPLDCLLIAIDGITSLI
jgi:hypothetical protein